MTSYLEEYVHMKVKEVRTQSLSPSLPLPLPDLQLVMTFIINGKQLEVQKQATVQIECKAKMVSFVTMSALFATPNFLHIRDSTQMELGLYSSMPGSLSMS